LFADEIDGDTGNSEILGHRKHGLKANNLSRPSALRQFRRYQVQLTL
jgi:hypothetical protein